MECDVSPDFAGTEEKDPLSVDCGGVLDNAAGVNQIGQNVVEDGGVFKSIGIIKSVPSGKEKVSIIVPDDEKPTTTTTTTTTTVRHTHHLRKPVPKATPVSQKVSKSQTQSGSSGTGTQASTMREVLASIPGFNLKTRRRSSKKMSTAAQIAQTHEGCIDLETPDSILVGTNICALLNNTTFSMLPPLYQYKLIQLLPGVDRPPDATKTDAVDLQNPKISSILKNEFLTRACQEWRDRLAEGEFTPENQVKLRTEAEKDKSKLDPWKLKHFEPIWGAKSSADVKEEPKVEVVKLTEPHIDRPALKTTIKLRPTTSIASSSTPAPPQIATEQISPKRIRTIGAVTRSSIQPVQQLIPDSSEDIQLIPSLKRALSIDETDESTANKILKPEDISGLQEDEVISVEVTTFEEHHSTLKLKDTTDSLDSEAYSETSNPIASNFLFDESSETTTNKTSSENLETITENELFYEKKGDEEDGEEESSPEIQYIFQNDTSCGAHEAVVAENSNSSNASSLQLHSHHHHHHQNMHDYHQNAFDEGCLQEEDETDEDDIDEDDVVDDEDQIVDNQIEIVSCDNDIISDHTTRGSEGSGGAASSSLLTTAASLSLGASVELGHQIKHHGSHLEELGISVSNEEIVTDGGEPPEDLLQSIQKIPIDDPVQIDEHFRDAEDYVLESEEMMDTGDLDPVLLKQENEKVGTVYQMQKTYNPIEVSRGQQISVTRQGSVQQIQTQDTLKNVNIDGTTFIVPSDWSYDGSKSSARTFQNVRIIQNDGIVLQSSSADPNQAPTQEQIMQAEILFEAPSTAEVKQIPEMIIEERTAMQQQHNIVPLHHPEMEVTSTVISNQQQNQISTNIRSEHICDPNTMINAIPVSSVHSVVHSSGNIIVAAANSPIRTINAVASMQQQQSQHQPPPAYSTICISSSAGMPMTVTTQQQQQQQMVAATPAAVSSQTTKAIQHLQQHQQKLISQQNFLLQKQQQQLHHQQQVHQIQGPTVVATQQPQQQTQIQHQLHTHHLQQTQHHHQVISQSPNIGTPVTIVQHQTMSGGQHTVAGAIQHSPQTTTQIQLQQTPMQQIQNKLPKQIIYAHPAPKEPAPSVFPNKQIIMSTNLNQPQVSQPRQPTTTTTFTAAAVPAQRIPQAPTSTTPTVTRTLPVQAMSNQIRQLNVVKARRPDPASTASVGGGNRGRGGRSSNSGRPPPGAVNLERSYQICQAVIQQSPNRHQLKAQLRPPQDFLSAAAAKTTEKQSSNQAVINSNPISSITTTNTITTSPSHQVMQHQAPPLPPHQIQLNKANVVEKIITDPQQTQFSTVTSSNKVTRVPLQQKKTTYVQQRQQSPNLIVRQVYTSQAGGGNSGVPTVISASGQHLQRINLQSLTATNATDHHHQAASTASIVNNGNGQYVLVQRTGIIQQESGQQRASSAPPSQNQVQNVNGIVPLAIAGRGRPASVDVDTQHVVLTESHQTHLTNGPNPGVQAVTRRGLNQGIPYSDASTDPNLQNYAVTGENSNSSSSSTTSSSMGIIVSSVSGGGGNNGNSNTTNCHCSLNAMVICQQCGAFTHEDCQKQKLCVSCVIR